MVLAGFHPGSTWGSRLRTRSGEALSPLDAFPQQLLPVRVDQAKATHTLCAQWLMRREVGTSPA